MNTEKLGNLYSRGRSELFIDLPTPVAGLTISGEMKWMESRQGYEFTFISRYGADTPLVWKKFVNKHLMEINDKFELDQKEVKLAFVEAFSAVVDKVAPEEKAKPIPACTEVSQPEDAWDVAFKGKEEHKEEQPRPTKPPEVYPMSIPSGMTAEQIYDIHKMKLMQNQQLVKMKQMGLMSQSQGAITAVDEKLPSTEEAKSLWKKLASKMR